MSGYFGTRVISEQQFAAEAEEANRAEFGDRVLGSRVEDSTTPPAPPADPLVAAAALLGVTVEELQARMAGQAATAPVSTPEPTVPAAPTEEEEELVEDSGELTEADVRDCLTKNPELFGRLVQAELIRKPNPRKGVSRLLLEHGKENGAPAETLSALEALV